MDMRKAKHSEFFLRPAIFEYVYVNKDIKLEELSGYKEPTRYPVFKKEPGRGLIVGQTVRWRNSINVEYPDGYGSAGFLFSLGVTKNVIRVNVPLVAFPMWKVAVDFNKIVEVPKRFKSTRVQHPCCLIIEPHLLYGEDESEFHYHNDEDWILLKD